MSAFFQNPLMANFIQIWHNWKSIKVVQMRDNVYFKEEMIISHNQPIWKDMIFSADVS